MTAKRIGKKILKFTGITIGLLGVLLVGFHFWFKTHARQMIEDMVYSKSHGKVKLKIQKIRFNYFSRKIVLEKAVFYNTDTLTGTTAYHFSIEKMQLRAKAILPIVFNNRILIDSLTLLNPHIEVIRLRPGAKPNSKIKKDVSIPEEMGKVYSSIQDALNILKVKRFQFDNGTFTLVNKIDPTQLPLTVSNLYFHIDDLQVKSGKLTGNENILFSKNVVLRSQDQNILFPDGRHRMSFSRFRVNLKKRLVEFDSCTIAATRGDSTAASFNVFFDALLLTNIDFDTLYKAEVIKADSVYCVNPKFNLDVEIGKKKGSKKPPPKLEDIIKQLTGDMELGYVVVSNADFNIKTVKNGVPSSFTFSNNNFEMQGLSVDQEAPKSVKVKSFAMAIRNYENFIKDSSYSVKFDSVVFKNDHITLSNFLFNKLDNGKVLNTFSIPQFDLLGLSWDDLVFEKKLRAEQAIMFSPHISYTAGIKKAGQRNIFQSLGAVDEYMDLQQLDIIDGMIDLRLKNKVAVQLDHATMSVKSQSLLESKKLSGIKSSLTQLKFDKGIIHAGNMDMELHHILYVGQTGQLGAGSINIRNKEKNMAVDLEKVTVKKMLVDETSGNVYAEGLRWQDADVKINTFPGKKDNGGASLLLKDVKGAHTKIAGVFNGRSVSTQLNSISFGLLEKKANQQLQLNGLAANGQQLKLKDKELDLAIGDYTITDNQNSSFQGIIYKNSNEKTRTSIEIPSLTLTPHIQPLLNGDVAVDGIMMEKPVIDIYQLARKNSSEIKKPVLPNINISELNLNQPLLRFTKETDSGILTMNWQGERNNADFLQLNQLHVNGGNSSLGNLSLYLTDFTLGSPKGKTFNTGNGNVTAQAKNIQLVQKENQPLEWSGTVTNFDTRDFRLDSIGKLKGDLVWNSGSLNNLKISSSTARNLQQLAAANPGFHLQQFTGHYSDSSKKLTWFNAGFNRNSNSFSMDSFSITPALSKDSFLAKQQFQTDYMNLRSGAVSIGPVDIDGYTKDKKLNIGRVTIDQLLFTDYKDKQLPFNAGIIKPLPVNMIRNIPQQLSIDTVLFTNANVEYTEFNEKTKDAGFIPVNRMTIRLLKVKNYNIRPDDSLSIQANGYLMDSLWIRLRIKESYTDSLGGFRMTVRMKPTDLSILNPFLIPLSSVKLASGYLDTLSLRAAGREYLAIGEMKMFYHDLRVRFLKDGNESKKNFLTGLITFIANSFIIRKNNKSRTGNVFFLRDRDRSAINYLIKIALSGMASSIGAKSNRKMTRRYRHELEKRNLPPVDFE